jgi:NAD(P)-dependent dehydrogenase (short-subunit alcohol dehydrogenase family)
MQHVLITGVSTGIGYDAARYLVERGWHVFGSVRKEADGTRVSAALGEGFTPLIFDVTDPAAVSAAVERVETVVGDNGLAGLVNNAGIAVAGPAMHISLADFRWQFEVNLFGQLDVTQKFLPLLGARKPCPHPPGRILNISSVSGQIVFPFFGPYAGSKHALEALSDALRRELLIYGVDVIVIEPGSIRTPIWEKADDLDIEKYAGTDYYDLVRRLKPALVTQGQNGLPVAKVSEMIWRALTTSRPRARYALVSNWLTDWILPRWLPDRWFDNMVRRRFGMTD